MERYEVQERVGEGTFGVVTRAVRREDAREVALKKIKMGRYDEGVHFVGLREVRLLQELEHPNIMPLLDVFAHDQNIYLAMPFLSADLEAIVKDTSLVLHPHHIRRIMRDLLLGVRHMHSNWVLHRDLKPGNVLFGADGQLYIADFGLARPFGTTHKRYTVQVVTLWYRAPELLFGASLYGPAVDMWAVGCIFAEVRQGVLVLHSSGMKNGSTGECIGSSEIDQVRRFAGEETSSAVRGKVRQTLTTRCQIGKIFHCLGTPTEEHWPGMTELPSYMEFDKVEGTPLSTLFPAASADVLDLLQSMLTMNPKKRITADQALEHPYFTGGGAMCAASEIPLPARHAEPERRSGIDAARAEELKDTRKQLF